MKKKLSDRQRNTVNMIIGSAISIAVLLLCSFSLTNSPNNPSLSIVLSGVSLILLALERLVCGYRIFRKKKFLFIRLIIIVIIPIVAGVLELLGFLSFVCARVGATIFYASIIVSRIFIVVNEPKKVSNYVTNALIVLLAIILMLVNYETSLGEQLLHLLVLSITTMFVAFLDVFSLVFRNIKRNLFLQIIKKSYALEIMIGLLVLISSFSIVLHDLEPGFANIGDAFWYCFAIVTTIGFGDFTCVTVFGRILSVILGIYGLVVVALITSIIVNFYNESNSKDDNKKEENGNKEIAEGDSNDGKQD